MSRTSDVLIVGGGFGGFSCFLSLKRKKRRATLLTNRDHFLFTPLLPQAAVGTIEVRSIVEPMRTYEKRQGEVVIGEATDLLPQEKKLRVRLAGGRVEDIPYQSLVLAAGATTSTFGIPGVRENCYFMKEMKDARALREKILHQFQRAANMNGDARKQALTFIIVGAGATGVEVACEIDDLVKYDLSKHSPELARETSIQIIEATHDILTVFDRTLAQYALKKLKQKGILIRTELPVTGVEPGKVKLASGESVSASTIIWATGNAAHPFTAQIAKKLEIKLTTGGQLPVDRKLRILSSYPDLYAIGDCSAATAQSGELLPQTARVAMNQGIFLGRELSRKGSQAEFHFRSMGMLASLGTGSAIADLGFLQFKGLYAWWFWKAAYLTKLVSLRNKVSVLFDWMKVKFFGRNTSRIQF